MRFNIKALAFTTAICWGGSILITGLANLIWTTYGVTMSKRISPESVQGGAFLTVMGLGTYQQNTWRMDDLEVHVSL